MDLAHVARAEHISTTDTTWHRGVQILVRLDYPPGTHRNLRIPCLEPSMPACHVDEMLVMNKVITFCVPPDHRFCS
jgi:hypothetical protein